MFQVISVLPLENTLWSSCSITELLMEPFPSKSGEQFPPGDFSLKTASEEAGVTAQTVHGLLKLKFILEDRHMDMNSCFSSRLPKSPPSASSHLPVEKVLLSSWHSLSCVVHSLFSLGFISLSISGSSTINYQVVLTSTCEFGFVGVFFLVFFSPDSLPHPTGGGMSKQWCGT